MRFASFISFLGQRSHAPPWADTCIVFFLPSGDGLIGYVFCEVLQEFLPRHYASKTPGKVRVLGVAINQYPQLLGVPKGAKARQSANDLARVNPRRPAQLISALGPARTSTCGRS
jgi:hypothetical protein